VLVGVKRPGTRRAAALGGWAGGAERIELHLAVFSARVERFYCVLNAGSSHF